MKHADFARLEKEWGIVPMAQDWLPKEFKSDFTLAMDAQPTLVTTPSSGIPAYLTMYVDPAVVRILQTPNKGAEVLGEKKVGDWTTQTAMFNVVENTGEVSSYGDFNANGRSDANFAFPQRQSYLFQTIIEYGERQAEVAGLAKLNWVAELQTSAAKTLDKFLDYTYHFGVAGLQCYGLLNDPSLSAAITPATKAAGGTKWVNNGVIVATANEVILDMQALYNQLVAQMPGYVQRDSKLTFVMPPQADVGVLAINSFGNDVTTFLTRSFPNAKIVVDPRYATTGGNVVQLILDEMDGADTGYCAFNEKLRDHRIVPDLSSFKQKKTSGTFGAIIRYPLAVAQMLGV